MRNCQWLMLATAVLLSVSACATTGAKPYPKKTCIVTENELGSMGDPVTIVHEGQEIKLCCTPCIKKFRSDPQKYLARLKAE